MAGAAFALAALVLAGCVAIPTSGDVQTAPLAADPDDIPDVLLPVGPEPGDEPAEIVAGFLRAGRGPQNGYTVARQFLTADAEWSPTSRVLVSSSPITPIPVDADTLAVEITVTAEVDAAGRYTEVPSQSQTLLFDVTQVDGEYRIARADSGTVVTPNAFAGAFGEYPVYFFDTTFDALVPDLRWFPLGRSTADRVVGALLGGPSDWLAGSVLVSAFPEGTTGQAVYDAPTVAVDLSAEVRGESAATQRRMLQQLEASLTALSNVTDVVVTAGGIDLDPAEDPTPPDVAFPVGDGLVGALDGSVGILSADGVSTLPGLGRLVSSLDPSGLSLAPDRQSAAVLTPNGVSLVTANGLSRSLDERAGLAVPALDRFGDTWSVPRAAPGGLLAIRADGRATPMPLALEGRVLRIATSRDGTRLLVALSTADGPRVQVLGIQRDAEGEPVALGSAVELSVGSGVVDAAWTDGTHVAVLQGGGESTAVRVLALGGPAEDLGEVGDGIALVGGSGTAGLRVLRADGAVLRPSEAGGWRETGIRASFLAAAQ